ncbi:MAG: phospholipase [Actinobacteria bacterium]|nr:phospholipase [Actinomycetota bacterium]
MSRAVTRLLPILIAVVATTLTLGHAPAGAGTTTPPAFDGLEKIEHIVMIMQENRTFDHYFGMFPGADGLPLDENGDVDICIPNPYEPGSCVRPTHDPRERQIGGPHNYRSHVTSVNGGKMDGFVIAFQDATKPCPKSTKPRESSWCERTTENPLNVMGYKLEEDIPNYWRYAREFVLQDRMFASSNSWSVPAHLYKVSGWSALCKSRDPMSCRNAGDDPDAPASWKQSRYRKLMDLGPDDEVPEFDEPVYAWTDITHLLHENDVSWASYIFAGEEPDCDEVTGPIICTPGKQHARTSNIWNPLPNFVTVQDNDQLGNIKPMKEFDKAIAERTLESVVWLTPNGAVSEHPRSKVSDGQAWVTRVVNKIMKSDYWKSTAIFVSWDDYGGFYDHVEPPVVDENGYGLRVPGLVISPYAKKGFVDHQTLSHDAYLKFIEDVFLGGQRLDPATDGRPDRRISVREEVPILGDLRSSFDFTRPPRPPLILDPYP